MYRKDISSHGRSFYPQEHLACQSLVDIPSTCPSTYDHYLPIMVDFISPSIIIIGGLYIYLYIFSMFTCPAHFLLFPSWYSHSTWRIISLINWSKKTWPWLVSPRFSWGFPAYNWGRNMVVKLLGVMVRWSSKYDPFCGWTPNFLPLHSEEHHVHFVDILRLLGLRFLGLGGSSDGDREIHKMRLLMRKCQQNE
jgi:hypothetical protein